VAEPTLYLFDGYNLLHAGGFRDPTELIDRLAGWVTQQGARGVVVFDGHGELLRIGRLEVRYAEDADTLIERLAAEHRDREEVCVVSSDRLVRRTSGHDVRSLSAQVFLRDLQPTRGAPPPPSRLYDRLDERTKAKLERLRRGDDRPGTN
jgi:predicted RNA-binding protein with PIN domain